MKKLLILLCILCIIGCQHTPKSFINGSVELHSKVSIPIVEGTLNGKTAYFIFDSGATINVLDASQAEKYGFWVGEPLNITVSGYGGTTTAMYQTGGARVTIGGQPFNIEFYGKDIKDIAQAVYNDQGIRIVGIVGVKFMIKEHMVLNFSAGTLSITPQK